MAAVALRAVLSHRRHCAPLGLVLRRGNALPLPRRSRHSEAPPARAAEAPRRGLLRAAHRLRADGRRLERRDFRREPLRHHREDQVFGEAERDDRGAGGERVLLRGEGAARRG